MTGRIFDIRADDYHADIFDDRPSLSASIANVLIQQSPAHARAAHPRLNPQAQKQEAEHFDIGTVSHSLLLEGEAAVEIIEAPDWRTKMAKEARDLARQHGRVPLLGKHYDDVMAMVGATREQLAAVDADPPLFTDGKAEQTLVWEENGVLCRSRLDWLRDDRAAIDDYKTTSRSANPESWSRTLFNMGCDVQAAFYLRGLAAVTGGFGMAQFRFAVQETTPPYALSVVSLAPAALELANAKVDYALTVWAACLKTGEWPAYPRRVAFAEPPAWEVMRWEDKTAEVAA